MTALANLLAVVIVATAPAAAIDVRYPGAVTVYECGFEQNADEDFDQWPLGWTRRHGVGFPRYLQIRIHPEASPQGTRALRMELDGGGAVAHSPLVEIDRRCSFVLEGFVRTQKLVHDGAFLSVRMLNDKRETLETFTTQRIGHTTGWTKLRLGPFVTNQEEARHAVIGLHLEPGVKADLVGSAAFDDIWFGRLARLQLTVDQPSRYYPLGQKVELVCQASGFAKADDKVGLDVVDAFGRPLEQRKPAEEQQTADQDDHGRTIRTSLIPESPGFYRATATITGQDGFDQTAEVSWIVAAPATATRANEFGWSLVRREGEWPPANLSRVLLDAGIGRVKIPLWADASESSRLQRWATLADDIRARGMNLVAILDQPPPSESDKGQPAGRPDVARAFEASPDQWLPRLEPLLVKLASQVEAWQLGGDHDQSLIDYPQLDTKVATIKKEMDRIGQNVSLVVPWNWQQELPTAKQPAWRQLAMSADPPLTAGELSNYLGSLPTSEPRCWVSLQPLEREKYPLEIRITDLVERMITAKIQKAGAVFLVDPYDASRGIMNADGTCGEMFLPWRTTAQGIGGGEYLGRVNLPGEVPNHAFARDGKVTMVVRSREPTQVKLQLGSDVRQIDVWGRSTRPGQDGNQQVIEAGSLPTFVCGVSEPITRTRLALALSRPQLACAFGVPQSSGIRVKSFFRRAAGGTVRIVPPEGWRVAPDRFDVQLGPGQEIELPATWIVPPGGTTGKQTYKVDFDLMADERLEFSAYGEIEVGRSDVRIEVASQLNESGDLEIEQRMINDSDDLVSFRCYLYAPNERRQRAQVMRLGRGEDVQTYRLPDGKSLLGRMLWLLAEEIGGSRVISYRFVADVE